MRELSRQALFTALALPALLRASLRLRRLERRCGLQELARRMARVPRWRLTYLDRPRYLEAMVHRFARPLPPRRFGPCLKRSLLLLDLLGRCGVAATLHLGAAVSSDGQHRFHAWTSVPGDDAAPPAAWEDAELWAYPSPAAVGVPRGT